MTSYHDLQDSTFKDVTDVPFTIIPGRPDYEQKERLLQEVVDRAISVQASYSWCGTYGLMATVMGAVKWQRLFPVLTYTDPTRPSMGPTLGANPTAALIRTLTDENNRARMDFAKFEGFRRGVGHNIRQCMDEEF